MCGCLQRQELQNILEELSEPGKTGEPIITMPEKPDLWDSMTFDERAKEERGQVLI